MLHETRFPIFSKITEQNKKIHKQIFRLSYVEHTCKVSEKIVNLTRFRVAILLVFNKWRY